MTQMAQQGDEFDDLERAKRVLERADRLAQITEVPGEIRRQFLSPRMREAHALAGHWMEEAGLTVDEDSIGNLIGHREGKIPESPSVVCGSHLDTVINAGRYDGILGVLVGIEAADAILDHDMALDVIAFADEEGTRFGAGYLGSRPFATGELGIELDRRDDTGTTVADVVQAYGLDPLRIADAKRDPKSLAGYVELHIEQGPVLEEADLAIGAVTGIAAQTRMWVTVSGEAGHAGTTPMKLRRDALAGAVAMAAEIEGIARQFESAVATIGLWSVRPGGINVIPNEVTFTIDHRAADDDTQHSVHDKIIASCNQIAATRGLGLAIERLADDCAVAFDQKLVDLVTEVCGQHAGRGLKLLSGAGHDAAMLASVTPTAMMFIRCKGGISHHPSEGVALDDVAIAIAAVRETLATMLQGQFAGR